MTLAFESPDMDPGVRGDLETVDRVFAVIFTLEMVVKMTALGIFIVPSSYLRDSWNVLDFTIVVGSLLDWILSSALQGDDDAAESLSFLKVLRLLRVLRPLKTIKRNRNMVRRRASEVSEPFEHPQGQPLGIFELLAFAIDWHRVRSNALFVLKRSVPFAFL